MAPMVVPGRKNSLKNQLRIMDRAEGDIVVEFDPTVAEEVGAARTSFAEARGRGMLAYELLERGKARMVTELDPASRTTILSPIVSGG